MVPIKAVMSELERIQSGLERTHLQAPLKMTLDTWDHLERKSICRVRDFYTLSPEERMPFRCPEEYYIAKALLLFSERAFVYVAGCLHELSYERTSFTVALMDYFCFIKPALIVEVAFNALICQEDAEFKDILLRYPQLVEAKIPSFEKGQEMTFLASALKLKNLYLAAFLIKTLRADVNSCVERFHGYRIPVFFLSINSDDLEFSFNASLLFFEDARFKANECFDTNGLNALVYAIHFCPPTFAYLVDRFGFKNGLEPNNLLLDAFSYSLLLNRPQWSLRLSEFAEHFNPAARNRDDETYLMMAAQYNCPEIVALLLRIGQERGIFELTPGFVSSKGKTALLEAIYHHSHASLQVLLDFVTQEELNDCRNYNPLALAMQLNETICIGMLLRHPLISMISTLEFLSSNCNCNKN